MSENFQNGYLYISDTGIPAGKVNLEVINHLDYVLANPSPWTLLVFFQDCFTHYRARHLECRLMADGALGYAAIMSKGRSAFAYRTWADRR